MNQLQIDAQYFSESAEQQLHEAIQKLTPVVDQQVQTGDYVGALKSLASAKGPVDHFFDTVMVMAEDPKIRDNRLALLAQLDVLMNRVADISKLSA